MMAGAISWTSDECSLSWFLSGDLLTFSLHSISSFKASIPMFQNHPPPLLPTINFSWIMPTYFWRHFKSWILIEAGKLQLVCASRDDTPVTNDPNNNYMGSLNMNRNFSYRPQEAWRSIYPN